MSGIVHLFMAELFPVRNLVMSELINEIFAFMEGWLLMSLRLV
jgi:hypothetical protein